VVVSAGHQLGHGPGDTLSPIATMAADVAGHDGAAIAAAAFGTNGVDVVDHAESLTSSSNDALEAQLLEEHHLQHEADTNLIVNYIPNSMTDEQLGQVRRAGRAAGRGRRSTSRVPIVGGRDGSSRVCVPATRSQLFSKYGAVESARIIKEKGTRKSLGYGFVRYRSAADAEQAIKNLNGARIENKTLKVGPSTPTVASETSAAARR